MNDSKKNDQLTDQEEFINLIVTQFVLNMGQRVIDEIKETGVTKRQKYYSSKSLPTFLPKSTEDKILEAYSKKLDENQYLSWNSATGMYDVICLIGSTSPDYSDLIMAMNRFFNRLSNMDGDEHDIHDYM